MCQNFIKDLKSKKDLKKTSLVFKKDKKNQKTKKRLIEDQKNTYWSKKKRPQDKKPKKDLCIVCVGLAMQAPPYPDRK